VVSSTAKPFWADTMCSSRPTAAASARSFAEAGRQSAARLSSETAPADVRVDWVASLVAVVAGVVADVVVSDRLGPPAVRGRDEDPELHAVSSARTSPTTTTENARGIT
jgi:hypothetical protein